MEYKATTDLATNFNLYLETNEPNQRLQAYVEPGIGLKNKKERWPREPRAWGVTFE